MKKKILVLASALLFLYMRVGYCQNSIGVNLITIDDPKTFYDFWVGTWEATWDESGGVIGKGKNKIEKILDQKVLLESFEVIEGSSKGFKGTSISVLNAQNSIWKQAWADNQGGYFDFEGFADGDIKGFKTQILKKDGKRTISRMLFKNISQDSFIWDWEHSENGGKSWNLVWRINYKREVDNYEN